MSENKQKLIAAIAAMIREVVGEEWLQGVEIGETTSFNEDLEVESIEFVALAEKVQAQYGDHVNFVDWLSTKELEDIIALTVGDVAEFIEQNYHEKK